MTETVQTPKLDELPPTIRPVYMHPFIGVAGDYPTREGGSGPPQIPPSITMGMVHTIPFDFPPFGAPFCDGQLLSIPANTALFSILGSNYGGDGAKTFGLPKLFQRIAVGGADTGEDPGIVLSFTAMIAAIPPPGSNNYPMVGMIALFGRKAAPEGWLKCDGSALPIAQYGPLFQAIGTTYGGDGTSTFCLPNLTTTANPDDPGSAPVGTGGSNPPWPPVVLGGAVNPSAYGGVPGLGLNYLICLRGVTPPNGGNGGFPPSEPVLGEIVIFAGRTIPVRWAPANGETVLISNNPDLFKLIGNKYGGDGKTYYMLPNLSGSMVMGA